MANPTTPTGTSASSSNTGSSNTGASNVTDAARDAAAKAAETARDAAAKASGTLENVAGNASQSAAKIADDAIDTSLQALDNVSQQSQGQIEDVVRSIGRAVDAASSSLENDGYVGSAGYIRAAANGLTQAADEVGGFDTHLLTDRVESYVRDKPFVIAGGLALLGFVFASSVKNQRR